MEEKPDVTLFTVGEEINPESHYIRLRISAINPEDATVEAVVIKAEEFFAAPEYPGTGFRVGMKIKFDPRWPHLWIPSSPVDLPWFELIAYADGRPKVFAHYR